MIRNHAFVRLGVPAVLLLALLVASPADAYRMIRRRAAAAGILTRIGNHSFRATGITEYLRNGGKLEIAQQMADHESARTTGLYDRRNDQVSLDEVAKRRRGQVFPFDLLALDLGVWLDPFVLSSPVLYTT